MIILSCEQKSPEWYAARRGIPTASEFSNIITPKRMEYASAADTYINVLIDELVRPDYAESFKGNRHTERGILLEPDARESYAFTYDVAPKQVGFILSDDRKMGVSPDSVINDDGLLEIKCPDGAKHVAWIRAGVVPDEHKPQVHGALIITEREWCDFHSYCPGYPDFTIRVYQDMYTEALRKHLTRFLAELEDAKLKFIDYIGK